MTLIIYFHQPFFKAFYSDYIRGHLRAEVSDLVSYNQFAMLMSGALYRRHPYLQIRLGQPADIVFIDSTLLPACHNHRIERHKVFADIVTRGRLLLAWFYGFRLHLIVSDHGELIAFCVTSGNVDDRKRAPYMTCALRGKLFGDKISISKDLFREFFERGLLLVIGLCKNMQNRPVPMMDKLLLRKRALLKRSTTI